MSELRKDIVSGDWTLVSPGRGKRPNEYRNKNKPPKPTPIKDCLFEDPAEAAGALISRYPNKGEWQIQVIPNKYPAVGNITNYNGGDKPSQPARHGLYWTLEAKGYHEVMVTRSHKLNFAYLPPSKAKMVFQAVQDRFRFFAKDKNVTYASFFQNSGEGTGASIYHPHYQLITLPIIPPDVGHSLEGSRKYMKKNKRCVHCDMIAWERKEKKRIIFENDKAVAFAPFVSKSPFEIRIFPKTHLPYFEETTGGMISGVAEAMQMSLKKINAAVTHNYNLFIHTAPLKDSKLYSHYHWHIEILPKVSQYGGFELETGVIINSLDPDVAAEAVKNARI